MNQVRRGHIGRVGGCRPPRPGCAHVQASTVCVAAIVALAAFTAPAAAQADDDAERMTANTLRFDPAGERPRARLVDAAWLVGSWEGEGLGGRVQEIWTPPAADRMTGAFISLRDGAVRFQELMSLVEVEGSLELWVKHFNADFSAWEDKEDFVRFRLVQVRPGALRFGGLTLERVDDDRMRAYLAMRSGEEVREVVIEYRRVHGSGDAGDGG